MFDEEYVEWENATQKCQELGARLPVLSDKETIKIVKKYLEEAEFEVFEVKKMFKSKQFFFFKYFIIITKLFLNKALIK